MNFLLAKHTTSEFKHTTFGFKHTTSGFKHTTPDILERIKALNKRVHDKEKVESIITDLCKLKPWKASEIATYFNREEAYFKRRYISPMIAEKKLKYLYPEMINHPEQAYLTNS